MDLSPAAVAPPVATLRDFRFTLRPFALGDRRFTFGGPDGFYVADLEKGGLQGELLYGLQAFRSPPMAARVRRQWEVSVPRRWKGKRNIKISRKVMVLVAPGQAVAVFRFNRPIPRALVLAFKTIFEKKRYPRDRVLGVPFTQEEDDGQQDRQVGEVHDPGDAVEQLAGDREESPGAAGDLEEVRLDG